MHHYLILLFSFANILPHYQPFPTLTGQLDSPNELCQMSFIFLFWTSKITRKLVGCFFSLYSECFLLLYFFSIHIYTHMQFEQLNKYMQKTNKTYKKWYTHKQSLDKKLFGISRKQIKKKDTKMG